MRIHKTPKLVKRRLKDFTWDIKNSEKKIYLTFDDGPTDQVTEWVLDKLNQYNAKATFFCIGKNVEKEGKVYSQLLEKGHSTGNHTYSHLNGWKTPNIEYVNDVYLASNFVKSKLFRPPYGRIKKVQREILRNNFRLIMWDILTFDYDRSYSRKACLKYATEKSGEGSIVVFHDSEKARKNLYFVLPEYLKIMTDRGFIFEKI